MSQCKSPQVEDGYVRIANELYDAIFAFGFKSSTLHVLMIILRKTYGYGKKEDDISASQIGSMCNMGRQHVTTALNELAAMRVIHKRAGKYGAIIGINKDYSSWVASPKSGQVDSPKFGQVSENCTSPNIGQVSKNGTLDSPKSGQVDSPKFGHTKDNLPKDNQQKKNLCANAAAFSRFWSAYPKKKSKGQAEKTFAKINPNEQLMTEILDGIERAKKSRDWKKDSGQYIPHPATWLNARGWEDEIDVGDAGPTDGAMHGNFASQDYRAGVGPDGSF